MKSAHKELKRLKAGAKYSTKEMSRLAWQRYEEIKEELEPDHIGKYVMIEVESGDYFLGESDREAYEKAKAKHPDKIFHFIRIGHKAAHKLKNRGLRDLHYFARFPDRSVASGKFFSQDRLSPATGDRQDTAEVGKMNSTSCA
jgi:hypothetical protein